MLRATVCALCGLALCVGSFAVELQQAAGRAGMDITLTPGSSRALVRDLRGIDYSGQVKSVVLSYGEAKIVADSIQIAPPPGLTVARSYRPAGKDNCLVWELQGTAQSPGPTVISYGLEGLKWRPLYRLTYEQNRKVPDRGSINLQAEIAITNDSGLDLEAASFLLALGGGEDSRELRVRDEGLDLPAGWSKQWPLVTAAGSAYIYEAQPVHLRHVYDPRVYGKAVHKLLMIPAEPGSSQRLHLLSLPEAPMELFFPGPGETSNRVPAVVTKWRAQVGQEDAAGTEAYMLLDVGVEPDIVVEHSVLASRKDRLALDKLGRVSGMDIIEQHRLTVTNHTGADVEMAVYQELLSTWEIKPKPPAAPIAEEDEPLLWSGPLAAGETRSLEFILIKHQGTNA